MANETFKDASGATKYRKTTGAGTSGDPAVAHNHVDSSVLPTGAATAALQGALTETAPATDTASSGLNGRLQRIAQRLTTLIGFFKAEDVAHVSGDFGMPIQAVRNDAGGPLAAPTGDYSFVQTDGGGNVRTAQSGGTFTAPARFSVTTTQQLLVAANAARKGVWLSNLDASAIVYWGISSALTTANGDPIYALERIFLPTIGEVRLIGSAAASVSWSEMT